MSDTVSGLAQKLRSYWLRDINASAGVSGATSGGGDLLEHALSGGFHTGTLADSQAPQFLKTDGSRTLTGNLAVADGVTIDGVDISLSVHPRLHDILDAADHSVAGNAGQVVGLTANDTLGLLTPTTGLAVSDANIILASTVAGAALSYTDGVLAVVPGEGLEIETDAVGLKSSVAGAGLAYAAGVLSVGVANTGPAGLSVEADAVRLTTSSNPGAAAKVLATDADGGMYLDTDLLAVDGANNRVGVNRIPGGAALDVQAANNADHTQRLKQKAGQTGRLWRVENAAGQELIVLDSEGNLQSGNPGFVSGLTGWQMSRYGSLEANDGWFRGELHASMFVMDEFHSSGGTLFIAPAGKLEFDAALSSATDVARVDIRSTVPNADAFISVRSAVSNADAYISARTIENYFDVTDPPSGHARVFSVGDRLRCKTTAMGGSLGVYDIWAQVIGVLDMSTHYRYYLTILSGTLPVTLPAGSAIINYREQGDGLIVLTSDQNYAPYLQVVISGARPWLGELTPTVRLGRLDGVGVPGVSGIYQHGIVLGRDLSDATAPYFIASDLQLSSYRIDSRWNDGANDTGSIGADGSLRFGMNIGQAATTGLAFDPVSGDVTIGSPTYQGTVTVYGQIYLPDGEAVESLHWQGEWASGTAYRRQDAVSWAGKAWIANTAHTASAGNAPTIGAEWDLMADQGADGADGATGPTGATGPQGPAGASIAVQYSVNGSTFWHSTFTTGDLFMRQSTDGGGTWGAAIRIVGEQGAAGADGTDGTDGNFVQYVFARAASQPATPTGNGVPGGWADAPPAGTALLWMSKATQTPAGVLVGAWSTPARITGDTGAPGAPGADGADNQDFPFLDDSVAALQARSAAAGMYMVGGYVGHYTGGGAGTFDLFMGVNGGAAELRFGGAGNAKLEYSGGKLRGVDTGGVEQWYASATDGKLYAGAGGVVLQDDGLSLITAAGWTDIPASIIAWYDNPSTRTGLSGRIAAGTLDSIGNRSGIMFEIDGAAMTGTNPDLWFRTPSGTERVYHTGNLPAFAASDHTHSYAASSHTHDYAASGHTHDLSAYAPLAGATFTGNVGVGAAPTSGYAFDVNGNTYARGNMVIGGLQYLAAQGSGSAPSIANFGVATFVVLHSTNNRRYVIAYNDGGTVKYRWMDLNTTGSPVWQYSTSWNDVID